jgi:hypothetical protein
VTLSPEPPGIFRFGLAPAGPAGGLVCRLEAVTPAVCKAHIGARGASPQSSILRCGVDTLPNVEPGVNYSVKLCFILTGRLVTQRAV